MSGCVYDSLFPCDDCGECTSDIRREKRRMMMSKINDILECSHCGHNWKSGSDGSHQCVPKGGIKTLIHSLEELKAKLEKADRDITAAHKLIAKLVEKGGLGVEEEDMVDSYFESLSK